MPPALPMASMIPTWVADAPCRRAITVMMRNSPLMTKSLPVVSSAVVRRKRLDQAAGEPFADLTAQVTSAWCAVARRAAFGWLRWCQ